MRLGGIGRGAGRRGLLAAAAGLVGAGLARLTGAERVHAGHTGPIPGTTFDGADSLAVHLGAVNTRNTTTTTTIRGTPPSGYSTFMVSNGVGVDLGFPFADGIQGLTGNTNAAGVHGYATDGYGVQGINGGSGQNHSGVWGFSSLGVTNGVLGQNFASTTNATGVLGQAITSNGATVGVWGQSTSPAAGAVGVLGEVTATSAAGIGVKGSSINGPGVYGTSTSAFGVQGLSTNAYGVSGNSTTQAGVWGSSNNNVGVLGTSTTGVGTVALDPDFAALIHADTYHVFLTPRGDCRGLYVSSQDARGLEVRELQGGTSSVGFSYRLMARPAALPTTRLDRLTLPPAPAQPQLDRVEPLDVPARLRDLRHPDRPASNEQPSQPVRVQDAR